MITPISWTNRGVTALVLTAALAGFGAETSRITLSGHVPTVAYQLAPKGRLPATNQVYLAIGLPLRNEAELDELLGQLYELSRTNFHKFLTPTEFAARFGPTEQDYQAVIRFAEANGLRVVGTHPNRVVLDVVGSVSSVERAFQVTLRTYRHPTGGRDFFAPDTEPSVPANLRVADMWGLTDYGPPKPLLRNVASSTTTPLNYNGSGPGGAYQGSDFRNAYASGANLTGTGQTAAVAEFDGYYPSDIANYEAQSGYPSVPLQNVLLDNVSGTPGYSGLANAVAEVSLDIELMIAMAPGLSKLIVYEGSSPYDVFARIATDNLAKQVSCSWAWSVGPTHNWIRRSAGTTLDSQLKQMASQGQTFFQASGDSDAYTGGQALSSSTGPIPVDSIYVTSVGGTSLTMNGAGASWSSETAWNWGGNTGSGGGVSPNYPIPYWQTNVSMAANNGSTINRNVPDVSLTADAVYVVYNNGSSGAFGGTSCAAPLWAGFCALVNQQSLASGGTTVGFLNPALYSIAAGANYSSCFHDITTGNNIGSNTPGLFNAVPGYDLATGLGTPNGTSLINALSPPTLPYFASQPAGQTVTNGANVALSATVDGQQPLTYQWLFNGAPLSAGGNLSGSTSNVLSIASATTNNAGNYSLVAANSFGSVTSSVAVLVVGLPPVFSAQPASLTILSGSNALFSAVVSGSSPLVYQWRKNGTNLANGTGISGATNASLTLSNIGASAGGNYSLLVTNGFGAATSSVATLTVVFPPTITGSLTNLAIQCGSNAALLVSASGTLPLSFQWSLDGSPIPGATGTSLSLANVHLPNHTVTFVVANLYGSVSSNVLLAVHDTLAPVITLNGSDPIYVELGSTFTDPGATASDLCMGVVPVSTSGVVNPNAVGTNTLTYTASDGNGNTNSATRSVIVRDTTPPAIVWSFTNLVLAAGTNCTAAMPDVTTTNYILATDLAGALTISQSPTNNASLALGTNLVVITVKDASSNAAYSTNTILVADQTPPQIVAQPRSVTNLAGTTATFSVGANACTPLSFQWWSNSVALTAGTNSTLSLSNISPTAAGNYSVVATAAGGSTTSLVATLTVVFAPAITGLFTNQAIECGSNSTFAVSASGTAPLSFQWSLDGSPIAGATDTSLSLANVHLPNHTITLVVTNPYATLASNALLTVRDTLAPVITLDGGNPIYVELGSAFTDPGAAASDLCAGAVPVSPNGIVNTNAVGTNTLTYTASDGNGNTSVATRSVIVRDTTPPTIGWSFTNLVVAAGTNCTAAMPDVTTTNFILATDLSGTLAISQSPTNNASLALGTNLVVLTVRDASSNATYSINAVVVADQTPPQILAQPQSLTNLVGTSATWSVGAAACTPVAFQWWSNSVALVSGTNSTLTLSNIAPTSAGNYSVVATAAGGSATSLVATLTVVFPPTITGSLTNQVIECGSNATFAVSASGTAPLSFQWTVDGTPIAGATSTSLSLANVHGPDHTVTFVLTNLYGSLTTNALLIVHDTLAPVITLNGGNPVYTELGSAFTDPGATASDLCMGVVPVSPNGIVNTSAVGTNTLTYTASDGNGNTGSATRSVIVRDTTPPTIVWSFTNLVVAVDTNCSAAMPNVTTTNYILATDLSGVLRMSQSPTNNARLPLGTNLVVITVEDVSSNAAYSTNAVVVADQTPPQIVAQPQSLTNLVGTTATFSVGATACTPVAFQWWSNGVALVSGNNSSLTLSNITPAAAGNYSVVATASGGSTTSLVATLTVNLNPTSVGFTSSADPSGYKADLNFSVTVAPASATGTIQFQTNGIAFDIEPLIAGQATSSNAVLLPRGTNLIAAVYSGDGNDLPATSALEQIVTNHPPAAAGAFYTRLAGNSLSISIADLVTNWADEDGDLVSLMGVSVSTNGVTLTNSAGALVYFDTNDVPDQFTCTISDGWGGTNYQTVIISIEVPVNPTPSIIGATTSPGGSFDLNLAGAPSYTYILESTTDLNPPANWLSIATNTVGTNGLWQFDDPQATNFSQRFYRLRLAP